MNTYISKFLDLIYVRKCLNCEGIIRYNSKNKWFCSNCNEFELVKNTHLTCHRCGRTIEYIGYCPICNSNEVNYNRGHCLFEYNKKISRAIIRYKFLDHKVYSEYFSNLMINVLKDEGYDYDYICGVPAYKSKKRKRGYSQTELIAKRISKELNIEYRELLKKVKNTQQQSKLTAIQRKANIKNTFKCTEDLEGKKILLIDDVLTTGYTINECSRVLNNDGKNTVDFFVIASTNRI